MPIPEPRRSTTGDARTSTATPPTSSWHSSPADNDATSPLGTTGALGTGGEDWLAALPSNADGWLSEWWWGVVCSRASCCFLGKTRRVARVPETRYAESGGLHIAYQAMGD